MAHLATDRPPRWPSRATAALPTNRALGDSLEATCFEVHPDAQLVVNAEFEVVASNRAARKLLAEGQGPRALAEYLVGGASTALRELRSQITTAIRSQVPFDEVALPVSRAVTFRVRVLPLGPAWERALMIVRRQDAHAARSARERFGFTLTECAVAERLSRGLTVPQIALQLEISIETVRCHLKQAYVKAGVHRQAELVAVMLGA